jgi:hypothetical protein
MPKRRSRFGNWSPREGDREKNVSETCDFCKNKNSNVGATYKELCKEKYVHYSDRLSVDIDKRNETLLFARAIIMSLIKALLRGKGFRVMSFVQLRNAVASLTPLVDTSKAEEFRQRVAESEYAFWKVVRGILHWNMYTVEGKTTNLTSPFLWVDAFTTVTRILKKAETALMVFFAHELAQERRCESKEQKAKCEGRCTRTASGSCVHTRHPYWEEYTKDNRKIWLDYVGCGIPAYLRGFHEHRVPRHADLQLLGFDERGVPRDEEKEESEQNEFAKDPKIGAFEIQTEENDVFVADTCRFCEHIRKDGLIGKKEAPLMCTAPCRSPTPNATSRVPRDVKAQTGSQISFARGIFMQFMVEQSRLDAPFTVLNLDAQRKHLERFKPYMSDGEIKEAESLMQEKEAELSAFVQGVMHENVATYPGRKVLLDEPGRWAESILYFMDIFTSCESLLSELINSAIITERKCEPDAAGNCSPPCTTKKAHSMLGRETTKCEYKHREPNEERRKQSISGIWANCGLRF